MERGFAWLLAWLRVRASFVRRLRRRSRCRGDRGAGLFGAGDLGAETAVGQMGGDGGAGGGFGGVAEELAVGTVHESVTAVEDAQRAERFELRGGVGQAVVGAEEGRGARRLQALLEGLEAVRVVGQAQGDVLAAEAHFKLREARAAGAEGAVEGCFGAVGEVVEMLGAALKGGAGAAEDGVGAEAGKALAEAEEVVAAGAGEAGVEAGEAVGDGVLGGGEEIGGGGGSGGVEIGGGVGDGGVGGVTDAGDDGDGAGGDGAGDDLGVEAVEVFPGAAAAGYEDDVNALRMGGKPVDAGGDFGGAVGALHGGGIDEDADRGVTAAADLDDVAQRRALQAGDDADAAGEGWQRSRVLEEALAAEAVFEGLRGGEQCAEARLLHGLGDELELAA